MGSPFKGCLLQRRLKFQLRTWSNCVLYAHVTDGKFGKFQSSLCQQRLWFNVGCNCSKSPPTKPKNGIYYCSSWPQSQSIQQVRSTWRSWRRICCGIPPNEKSSLRFLVDKGKKVQYSIFTRRHSRCAPVSIFYTSMLAGGIAYGQLKGDVCATCERARVCISFRCWLIYIHFVFFFFFGLIIYWQLWHWHATHASKRTCQ